MLVVIEPGPELPLEGSKDMLVLADGVETLVRTLVKVPEVDVLRYVLRVTEVLDRGVLF